MEPTLTTLETLARQAGELLRRSFCRRPGFGPALQINQKSRIDIVTEVDQEAENFLIGEIRRQFPEHGFVAEESGELGNGAACRWFIDPLDGTVNFAHGVPIFSVSIAYQDAGVMRFGAVYDPIHDECFSAEKGQGAWLNGEPIQASATRDLVHSLLVTGFPYDIRENPVNNLDNYVRFSLLTQGVRRLGSAALDLCYVAAGRLDGCWEIRLSSWDVAAGGLIAEEAGARVTNLSGEPDYLSYPQSIMAANPHIHTQMLRILQADDP